MAKSSKERVTAMISDYEKRSRQVNFSVSVQAKDVDGEIKKVYCVNSYGPCCSVDEIPPLPKEYTDKERFIEYLKAYIDKAESQI